MFTLWVRLLWSVSFISSTYSLTSMDAVLKRRLPSGGCTRILGGSSKQWITTICELDVDVSRNEEIVTLMFGVFSLQILLYIILSGSDTEGVLCSKVSERV